MLSPTASQSAKIRDAKARGSVSPPPGWLSTSLAAAAAAATEEEEWFWEACQQYFSFASGIGNLDACLVGGGVATGGGPVIFNRQLTLFCW